MTNRDAKQTSWTGLLLVAFTMSLLASCSTPLSKGWSAFEKDKFDEAKKEWALGEKPEVKALVHKADAANKIVDLNAKAEAAEAKKQVHTAVQYRIYITFADKWPKDKWIGRSKTLQAIMDKSIGVVEEARVATQKEYDQAVACGKEKFKADEYKEAKDCFNQTKEVVGSYRGLRLKTTDIEFMVSAVDQALEIERKMEEERRAAEIAKQRYEAEQARIFAEQKRAAEEKLQAEERAKELARIAVEEERQRVEAEKKRRWMAFLSKGRPLKPLVATVGIPSHGKGTFRRLGEKAKFQGGAQFPILRKKGLKAEDLFALEIVVNRDDKATYLRNYSRSRGDLLKLPQVVSGKKHYYTEGYKGGRFYTEVENVRPGNKYEIQAVIYKIPVVH